MYNLNNTGFRKPLPQRYFHVSFWLIGINVLVFLLAPRLLITWDLIGQYRLSTLFSLAVPLIKQGHAFWGFITYMFTHEDFYHLLFNMIALLIFGPPLEKRMGSWEFLIYYLTTGILVGIAAYFIYLFLGVNAYLLGASGAIYAVLLGFAAYYPSSKIYIWGILPIRAPILILIYTGMEVFGILRRVFSSTGGNVSHLAHLFGFLFGFLYLIIRMGINPIKAFTQRDQNQDSYF